MIYDLRFKIYRSGHFKISLQYCLLPAAACLLLAFASCTKENNKPQWDTEVLAPFLKSSLSIKDLLSDTLVKANADNSLKLVYSNHLYQFSTDTLLHIPDTTVTKIEKLDSIKLSDMTIVNSMSLGQIAQQAGFMGLLIIGNQGKNMTIPAVSFSPGDIPVNAQLYFQTITLLDGSIDVTILNGLPIGFTNVSFQLVNSSNGSIILQDIIPVLAANSTFKQTYSLAGKTVEGTMTVKIPLLTSTGSGGSPVLIDTANAFVTSMKVRNLKPSSATAVFPAQNLVNDTMPLALYLQNVQLTTAKIKSGKLIVEAFSTLQDTVHFHYEIPSAKYNGTKFQVDNTVLPANGNTASHFFQTYDFTDYDLDLTGREKDTVNTLYTIFIGRIDASGQIRKIALTDSFYFYIGFLDIIPSYAKGYLGQTVFDIPPTDMPVDLFNQISSGKFQVEDVKMNFTIENGIGADAQVSVKDVISTNTKNNSSVKLTGTPLNTPINIPRATEKQSGNPPVTPSFTTLSLNNTNSNAKPFMENMPNKLNYSLQIKTSPNGNTSNSNDFMYYGSNLDASLNLEIPLSLISDKLTLVDTADFSLDTSKLGNVKSGILTLLVDNGFPFDAGIQLYLLDAKNNIKDSLLTTNSITAAPVDANFKVSSKSRSKLLIPVNSSKLTELGTLKKMKIVTQFSTNPSNQYLKIYSDYKMDLKLIGDFIYRIE